MSDSQFPILGSEIPKMLGRAGITQRIWNDLTKPTPSNLSIIGPRFMGKTVIMNALVQRMRNPDSGYEFILYWHLGRVAPASNEEFIAELCDRLRACLAQSNTDTSDYRKHLETRTFGNLAEVTEFLDSEKRPILMLWDGFEKPLRQGKLSAHLWDQMRSIFYGSKHKIITASRAPLSELICDEETSPFWNIFDVNPVRVGTFDDHDVDAILGELPQHSFQPGAKTELMNWSAGHPPLLLGILNQLLLDVPRGPVDNQAVVQSALKAVEKLTSVISTIWGDCPAGAKDLYIHLVERGNLPFADVGNNERRCLMEKGFARRSGNNLTASCRMLQEYIQGTAPDSGAMARLFGRWDDYKCNIRSLLEHRLAQISSFDNDLRHLVTRAIEEIPEFPDQCLNNLTMIEERALDLIWQREFGTCKAIPQDIIEYWNRVNSNDKIVQHVKAPNSNIVPGDRGLQCGLLQLLTGSKFGFESKARFVSKDSYVLINAIHSFRNRGQHPAGQQMHVGVAVAAIMGCLELLACLDRELAS